MALFQQTSLILFLRRELPQTGFDHIQEGFALLDQLRRLDQPCVDALALGRNLVEVFLQLLGAAFAGLQPPREVSSRLRASSGARLSCAAASCGTTTLQAATMQPRARALSVLATSLANPPSKALRQHDRGF